MPQVSVVIVTHRSASTIARTLECAAQLPVEQVVVVDNDSPDETVAVVKAHLPANGSLVRQRNVGFGAGNNAGVHALTKPVDAILFLNPDAVIDAGSLTLLAEYVEAHPRIALVAPRMFRGREPIGSSGRDATALTELERTLPVPIRRFLPRRPIDPALAHTGAVAYVEGACMLIRRDAYDAVGGFDEGFFLFFEELDIAQRLRRASWEVHLVAEASADHEVAASRASTELGGEPHFVASTYRYLAKWRGRRSAQLWFAAVRGIWSAKVLAGRLPRAHGSLLVEAVKAEQARWAS